MELKMKPQHRDGFGERATVDELARRGEQRA
jgi:hypothetical protein